jgi:hypothetical protein
MLTGYIDDSGSEPSSPTFVLAGYVLPAEKWAQFSNDWESGLHSGKSIDYLHMQDTGKHIKNGQFEGWDIDEREEKLRSLAAIIQSYKPFALAAHAQWSEFKKFKERSSRASLIQDPYKALIHEITRIMCEAGKRWNNQECVDFVFDEQGEIGSEAVSWYMDMKAAYPPSEQLFFGSTPTFRKDTLVLPLQAADMLAWFQRRRIWKPVVRPAMQEIEKMITEGFAVGSEIDADGFERAAIDFEKVGFQRKEHND